MTAQPDFHAHECFECATTFSHHRSLVYDHDIAHLCPVCGADTRRQKVESVPDPDLDIDFVDWYGPDDEGKVKNE